MRRCAGERDRMGMAPGWRSGCWQLALAHMGHALFVFLDTNTCDNPIATRSCPAVLVPGARELRNIRTDAPLPPLLPARDGWPTASSWLPTLAFVRASALLARGAALSIVRTA